MILGSGEIVKCDMVEPCQGTKETMDMKNMVYGFRSKADMQGVASKMQ